MCSAGGPMMLDSFCVDSDTYRCDDCGEEFTYKGKKKAACPKCKLKKGNTRVTLCLIEGLRTVRYLGFLN